MILTVEGTYCSSSGELYDFDLRRQYCPSFSELYDFDLRRHVLYIIFGALRF
jgi:hypothetical protein